MVYVVSLRVFGVILCFCGWVLYFGDSAFSWLLLCLWVDAVVIGLVFMYLGLCGVYLEVCGLIGVVVWFVYCVGCFGAGLSVVLS